MDEFLTQHLIEDLTKQIIEFRRDFNIYQVDTKNEMDRKDNRISFLESKMAESNYYIDDMRQQLIKAREEREDINFALNKANLVNIKQEMTIRTMMNMNQMDVYGMYVDTFTTDDGIDWASTIRGEWIADVKAIGKRTSSMPTETQRNVSTSVIITSNTGEDNALAQLFVLDKDQDIDKLYVYVGKVRPETWRPIRVSISTDIGGSSVVTSMDIPAENLTEESEWVELMMPNIQLNKYTDYYLHISTQDTYGYKVGVDLTGDKYVKGTSYVYYNNIWSDNGHDLAFDVWCFAAKDENNATIITTPKRIEDDTISIIFEEEHTTWKGTVMYYVSRDDGATWKILEAGVETMLEDLPPGNQLRIKVEIEGDSQIDAWGYVLKRGE